MSLLAEPKLPPVPTAPHSRVSHIFYTSPYIKDLFNSFLEEHPECDILETDSMVDTISTIYLIGYGYTPLFWKERFMGTLPEDKATLDAMLEKMRSSRVKHGGRRLWEYFQPLWNKLSVDKLPSRKSRSCISRESETPAETMVRIRLVQLVLRLVDAEINPPPKPPIEEPRPRRLMRASSRHKKTEP